MQRRKIAFGCAVFEPWAVRLAAIALLFVSGSSSMADGSDSGAAVPTMAQASRKVERKFRLATPRGRLLGGLVARRGQFSNGDVILETEFVLRSPSTSNESFDQGEGIVIRRVEREWYGDRGEMRGFAVRQEEGAQKSSWHATIQDGYARVQSSGGPQSRVPLPASWSTDRAVFQSLTSRYREGETGVTQEYDALVMDGERVVEKRSMTLLGRKEIAHDGRVHEGYLVEVQSPSSVSRFVLDEEFFPMAIAVRPLFVATWVDGDPLEEDPSLTWRRADYVPVDGRLPIGLEPIGVELAIRGSGVDSLVPVLARGTRYQTVNLEHGELRVVLRSGPTTGGEATKGGGDLPEIYLSASRLIQSDSRVVKGVAREITRNSLGKRQSAESIVRWVQQEIADERSDETELTTLEILAKRSGDCTEHASVAVALCRAAKIPARIAYGLLLSVDADGSVAANYHAWIEVYLDGWTSADPTTGEFGTKAVYILIGLDATGEDLLPGLMAVGDAEPELVLRAYRDSSGSRVDRR